MRHLIALTICVFSFLFIGCVSKKKWTVLTTERDNLRSQVEKMTPTEKAVPTNYTEAQYIADRQAFLNRINSIKDENVSTVNAIKGKYSGWTFTSAGIGFAGALTDGLIDNNDFTTKTSTSAGILSGAVTTYIGVKYWKEDLEVSTKCKTLAKEKIARFEVLWPVSAYPGNDAAKIQTFFNDQQEIINNLSTDNCFSN